MVAYLLHVRRHAGQSGQASMPFCACLLAALNLLARDAGIIDKNAQLFRVVPGQSGR
jgi:hypothetical protein